jgi:hypothetical protein
LPTFPTVANVPDTAEWLKVIAHQYGCTDEDIGASLRGSAASA